MRKADLIAMASHGRRGVAAAVMGSQATRILTYSKIPVPGSPCWPIADRHSGTMRPKAVVPAALGHCRVGKAGLERPPGNCRSAGPDHYI
ncbi:universal stress protein [uncultured Paracoccus sp.]|uniref:universal stress protein n=1 Tax=uncultured Paracoccus sp. TaxID=189685 RepID=UPI003459A419